MLSINVPISGDSTRETRWTLSMNRWDKEGIINLNRDYRKTLSKSEMSHRPDDDISCVTIMKWWTSSNERSPFGVLLEPLAPIPI
jgi:hypothetical protein